MTNPPYWQSAIDYLASKDQVIARLIETYPYEAMLNHQNSFYTLVKAIVGQQTGICGEVSIPFLLSIKSFSLIWVNPWIREL